MHEIAATQAAAGLAPELFEAMATHYTALAERTLARRDAESIPPHPVLDDVLRDLAPDCR